MDPDTIAPMIVLVTLILTAGGVAILRPIANRLAELVDMLSQQRAPPRIPEQREMLDLLASIDARLTLLEERQSFAESLLEASTQRGSAPHAVPQQVRRSNLAEEFAASPASL